MPKITNEEIVELGNIVDEGIHDRGLLTFPVLSKVLDALDRLEELEKQQERLTWKPIANGINNEYDLFEIRTGGDISTTHVVLQLEDVYDIDETKNQREGMYFGRWYLEDIIEDYPNAEWREIVEAI